MDKIDEVLTRAVDKVLPNKQDLKKLLAKKKIRLYLGIDPTATKLHLGHTVPLRKIQQFADLGHEVILLFGTGTVLVGDPSERDQGRQLITEEEIAENVATWKKQVAPIIDFDKVQIKYNGDWLTKLKLKDIINLGSKVSAVQLFKRDSFQKRLEKGGTVWYHETMYPLLQGYDSVVMDVDLEIGGTDQTFNMLIGRELQKKINHREKFVLTCQMIMGTDGKQMSKTSGNCIWLTDTPQDMFGKIMRTQDKLVPKYFEFFTDKSLDEIKDLTKAIDNGQIHPMDVKKNLAEAITKQFYGQEKAHQARIDFENSFQKNQPEYKKEIPSQSTLVKTIAEIAGSASKAKRLIEQGAVDVNGITVNKPNREIKGGEKIKVGKKIFVKVKS